MASVTKRYKLSRLKQQRFILLKILEFTNLKDVDMIMLSLKTLEKAVSLSLLGFWWLLACSCITSVSASIFMFVHLSLYPCLCIQFFALLQGHFSWNLGSTLIEYDFMLTILSSNILYPIKVTFTGG